MIEIRFHGRGGQGAVIASKILACAIFKTGKYVQSFPKFGVERRGAPIEAYLRVDDGKILLRNNVYNPDHLIVMDASLIESINLTSGLKEGGLILINSSKHPSEFLKMGNYRYACVDASSIAVRNRLGGKASPIVNTAILGAVSASMGIIDIDRIVEAIGEEVPIKPKENAKAAREAFEQTVIYSPEDKR
jgi:2-oxoacid:acceptor oxidoreductase gamma subunit (pyruvate/2-ketoisovalerate family)